MRVLLGTALGGLMLAATTLPAAAGEPLRLTDDHLDQVTAGSALIGLVLGGNAQASGSLFSRSRVYGEVLGQGNDDVLVASGYVMSGGLSFGGGASSSANSDGAAFGDHAVTITVPVSGGSGWYSFAASITAGVAVGLP